MQKINESRMLLADVVLAQARNPPRYLARYALPGGPIHFMKLDSGQDVEFDDYGEAANNAHWAAVELFNNIPPAQGKPERYKKISGAVFADLLRQAEITVTYFAYLYGTSQKRLIAWMRGEEDVAHSAFILARIFADQQINDRAIAVAETATEEMADQRSTFEERERRRKTVDFVDGFLRQNQKSLSSENIAKLDEMIAADCALTANEKLSIMSKIVESAGLRMPSRPTVDVKIDESRLGDSLATWARKESTVNQ